MTNHERLVRVVSHHLSAMHPKSEARPDAAHWHDRRALLTQYRKLYTLWVQEITGIGSEANPGLAVLERQLRAITAELADQGVQLQTGFSALPPPTADARRV